MVDNCKVNFTTTKSVVERTESHYKQP